MKRVDEEKQNGFSAGTKIEEKMVEEALKP